MNKLVCLAFLVLFITLCCAFPSEERRTSRELEEAEKESEKQIIQLTRELEEEQKEEERNLKREPEEEEKEDENNSKRAEEESENEDKERNKKREEVARGKEEEEKRNKKREEVARGKEEEEKRTKKREALENEEEEERTNKREETENEKEEDSEAKEFRREFTSKRTMCTLMAQAAMAKYHITNADTIDCGPSGKRWVAAFEKVLQKREKEHATRKYARSFGACCSPDCDWLLDYLEIDSTVVKCLDKK